MPDSSDNVNSGARASAVDWSRPIEAVHEATGDTCPAQVSEARSMTGARWVTWPGNATWSDGQGVLEARWDGWRIRNVRPTTPELDPALWDRMVDFVWRLADRYNSGSSEYEAIGRDAMVWMRDAHDMTADLPKPVDPDLIEAREIAAAVYDGTPGPNVAANIRNGRRDDGIDVTIALAAIKRGRELAGEQA